MPFSMISVVRNGWMRHFLYPRLLCAVEVLPAPDGDVAGAHKFRRFSRRISFKMRISEGKR